MRAFSLSTCLLLAVAPGIHAQAALATNQTPMHWGPAPAVFPPGARMAVVSGPQQGGGLYGPAGDAERLQDRAALPSHR